MPHTLALSTLAGRRGNLVRQKVAPRLCEIPYYDDVVTDDRGESD